jgi:uncharacterized protein (TIGR03437 family)
VRLIFLIALLPFFSFAEGRGVPAITPAPNGPYHIAGNRILDRQGHPYLIRGTELAPLTPNGTEEKDIETAFGPLSSTSLITIRQRLNMNAVRLPVSATEYIKDSGYRSRVEHLVRLANQLELLVILQSSEPLDLNTFWVAVAARFKDNPNIFFAPLSSSQAAPIRQSGARQPIIVSDSEDPNIIYEVTPHYARIKTQQFASAAATPLLVNGLDPQLDQASEDCAFPADPSEAMALIAANLAYFDVQQISWTLSSFTAGKLITDYRSFDETKLDAGWTCGQPSGVPAGIGMALLSHLWSAKPLSLFSVSENRGGLAIARGGISTAYGPILADEKTYARGPAFPKHLGNVSIRVTDSRGVARLASLMHTGAGWSYLSYIMPDECATGPAEVAVVRTDGSVSASKVLIADIAPGLFTAPPDGRSFAVGQATQRAAGKPDKSFPTWECGQSGCRAVPIPLSPRVWTTVRLLGTGFRYAGEHPDVRVTVGGIRVPVLSTGRSTEPGNDQLAIRLPDALRGAGETDLYFTVNGELSNVVRINCGTKQ